MSGSLKLLDPIVKCPYEETHFIAKSRLQKHIVKCEKKYPPNYKLMCPYNATHRLFRAELEEHIVTCPSRSVLSGVYPEPRKHGARNFLSNSEISSVIDCKENWDAEVDRSRDFRDQEYSSENDSVISRSIRDSKIKETTENKGLRTPRGFSEAMLRESNEDSCVEDLESIVSSMGIGRGRATMKREKLKPIGFGRGVPMNTNF